MKLVRHATINTDNKSKTEVHGTSSRHLVWDLPTRLFHWLLALCLTGSWITAEAGFNWTETHFLLGYCSLTLILFRIVWGIVGPTHARFREFFRGPKTVLAALPKFFSRAPNASIGHNPVGGWSVILFLVLVAVQVTTGLFISDDIFYAGPYNGVISSALAGTLAGIHHTNVIVLQTAVVIHILAIIWYALGKRTNLVAPMISGKKTLDDTQRTSAILSSQLGKAVLILAMAAVLVLLLVQLAPPPPVDDYY